VQNDFHIRKMKGIFGGFAVLLISAAPLCVRADVRPLSHYMLTNLQATNAVGEGVATEDYAAVESAARDLQNTAREIRTWTPPQLGFEPSDKAKFDGYLKLQDEISGRLIEAARNKQAPSIVKDLDQLLGKSCLGCHRDFRDRQGILKASTLFMTSFVNTWKEINRGLLLNDLALVARSARSLESTGQVMSWDPVLQSSFGISQEARREKFRGYLNSVIGAAGSIEDAATRGEPDVVRKALVEMWRSGCISCHQEFR